MGRIRSSVRNHRRLVGLLGGLVLLAAIAVVVVFRPWQGHSPTVAETRMEPLAIRLAPAGTQDRTVAVGFEWLQNGWCVGEFHAQATETAQMVRVGSVIDRPSRGPCAGVGTVGVMAWTDLTLATPLGSRAVVRASDNAVLPVYASDDFIIATDPLSAQVQQVGGNGGQPLSRVIGTADVSAARYLARQLDRLPSPAAGSLASCPPDDGSYYSVRFTYSAGATMLLKVHASGCQGVYIDDIPHPAALAWFAASCGGCSDPSGVMTALKKLVAG